MYYYCSMKKQNKQINYAYLAGYVDGDGCFYIGKIRPKGRISNKFPASITISSANISILNKFKKLYGGSVQSNKKVIKGHKQLHYYILRKKATFNIINCIYKYLVEKKEEAEIVKSFIESKSIIKRTNLINNIRIHKDINNLVSKNHKNFFESTKNTITPSEEDYAYLAGFIDAECSLGISRYKPKDRPNFTYKILLQLNNTKAPIFKWLLERFGGHINFINRLKTLKSRKNQLCWRLSGKALSKLLPSIYPYLEHKKPVCGELIKFYETTLKNGGARHTDKFRESYAMVIKTREEIVKKVHKLNLKGNINT